MAQSLFAAFAVAFLLVRGMFSQTARLFTAAWSRRHNDSSSVKVAILFLHYLEVNWLFWRSPERDACQHRQTGEDLGFERCARYSSGKCSPHLGAQLVGLHFGLFLEPVVGVVVCEGVLDERSKHKHVADPEVDIQRLDGRGSGEGRAGAHHQRGHSQNGGDPWKKSTAQTRLRGPEGRT